MFIIRNKKDLSIAYWILRDYQKNNVMNEEQKQIVKSIKTEIRRYYREHPISENVLVRDNGIDGYIIRFPLPNWIEDEESGKIWFKENKYIHYRPTYYDCTGQAFTSWFKVYKNSDGRLWAYHNIRFDI